MCGASGSGGSERPTDAAPDRPTGAFEPHTPRATAREIAGTVVQHGLLFGFAAIAAGISAQGLTGFARDDMRLTGPWPYLLFFALDGAAGLCAVLLLRRAARGETAIAPRLAVWGLVAASGAFNWAHAPARPGAPEAFALMPLIAATLFEFSLRETRRRASAADRRLAGRLWLNPAEWIRLQLRLAADPDLTAAAAARRVRVGQAADRLFELRQVLDRATARGGGVGRRLRRAERRARAALSRAGFADRVIAAEVLGHVQVLTMTATLASLDYATPHAARTALSNLLAASPAAAPAASAAAGGVTGEGVNGSRAMTRRHGAVADVTAPASAHPASAAGGVPAPAGWLRLTPVDRAAPADGAFPAGPTVGANGAVRDGDEALVRAAYRVVAAARREGAGLSQTALASRLRAEGYRIANERLRWLAAVTGLSNGDAREHR